mmetsp:Transcript_18628/g.20986  ORF Transcript_18628/g.20986 Transcript_18628/m.20986 type:complete len:94 (-) Transcript_18628:18-299(-)
MDDTNCTHEGWKMAPQTTRSRHFTLWSDGLCVVLDSIVNQFRHNNNREEILHTWCAQKWATKKQGKKFRKERENNEKKEKRKRDVTCICTVLV